MTSKFVKQNDKPILKKLNTKSILKGGNLKDDKVTQGSILIEQAFQSNQMAEFKEIIKKKILRFKTK